MAKKRARAKMPRRSKPLTEQEGLELLAQITHMIDAWEKHAPDKKFAGMTLEEFKKETRPSFDTRAEVARLEWEIERLKASLGEETETPKH